MKSPHFGANLTRMYLCPSKLLCLHSKQGRVYRVVHRAFVDLPFFFFAKRENLTAAVPRNPSPESIQIYVHDLLVVLLQCDASELHSELSQMVGIFEECISPVIRRDMPF